MNTLKRAAMAGALLALVFLPAALRAQQKGTESPATYDAAREVTLIGTVASFQSSADASPHGPHALVKTADGNVVDVHLGDARFLAANHFVLASGDSVRIIGEYVSSGGSTQFLARIIQKGTQVLAVRSIRGIPLSYVAPRKIGATAQGVAQ